MYLIIKKTLTELDRNEIYVRNFLYLTQNSQYVIKKTQLISHVCGHHMSSTKQNKKSNTTHVTPSGSLCTSDANR